MLFIAAGCWRLAGKFRDLRGKLKQRYPDVRGVLREATARVKLWRGTWRRMGSGHDPTREGRVIAELRKLQQVAQEEHDSTKEKLGLKKEVAAAETGFDSSEDELLTSDSEADEP